MSNNENKILTAEDETSAETLETVLTELRELRQLINRQARTALNYEDIGQRIGVHHSTVRRMSTQPGFPQLREYQTGDKGHTIKRFPADEVDEWIARKPSLAS